MKTLTMTTKKIFLISFYSLFLLLLSSCEDFIDIDDPDYLLNYESVFSDPQTVEATLLGVYAQLRSNVLLTGAPQGLNILLGSYTDELDYFSVYSLPEEAFYRNILLPSNETVNDLWNGCFNMIYTANTILEGTEDSIYLTPEDRDQFRGEALFIRGLIHFYLTNLFGEIPYIITTDYEYNKIIGKEKQDEIYARIIRDLKEAQDLLSETDNTGYKVRPNRKTATALLARASLYNKEWEKAIEYASELIQTTEWETDISKIFLKESPSILWQLQPQFEGQNTLENQAFVFYTIPPPVRALTPTIVEAFETDDLRKTNWVNSVTDGDRTFYYAYKYQHGVGEPFDSEYSVIFRLSEQYLIRAESLSQIGDLSSAATDLNKVRTRAGLDEIVPNDKESLIAAITHERQVEFFTEHGHRFFDLKRLNLLTLTLTPTKAGWKEAHRLLPIPERELLLNPNLKPQNPGY